MFLSCFLVKSSLPRCSCMIICLSPEFFFVFSTNIDKFGALWHKWFELTKVTDTLPWRMLWEDFYKVFFAAFRYSRVYKSWVNSICLERVVALNCSTGKVVTLSRLSWINWKNTKVSNNEWEKTRSISKDAKTFFYTNSCAPAQLEAQFPCF